MASSQKNYDVFLNFRGTDVRNNFISHLYAALNRNGIHTYKDSEDLWKGKQISPALMRAIEESHIAIVVFSRDYASSRWCLRELAKIMKCKAGKELIVLPVFYKVEPREVRRAYERTMTMTKHEIEYGKDSKTVKGWKKALLEAGKLSGWHINNENEAEIIQDIVEKVSSHLERALPLDVAEHPVRIDSRVQEVISLSQKESDDVDVLMIGLWGPGGIGKTTLAKAIYNAINGQFQGFSFLDRVRETSNKSDGLVDLQQKLLSQILSPRHPTVYSIDRGISLIRERLRCKKVLLILDDVDQLDQLKALAGGGDWFGKGSRIFVTTRDQHLLTSFRCKSCVYEVETLKNDEALDLFVRHAFPNSKKVEIRKDLIDGALHYASGLPLALEVLGSFLRGRNEQAWESALHKLSKSPHQTINRVLMTSFEALEDNERGIFLDIACFFKGKSIEHIKEVLDGCDFHTTIGIDILIHRSLIRNEHGTLQMHDLVQLMGKNIVMQESFNDPRKRSRLWIAEDVLNILCEDMEKDAVEAMVLDLASAKEITTSLGEITIRADAFRNMKNLRILILPEVHISSEGPVHVRLPNNLRWLEWPNAPFLEFGFGLKKLVGLSIQKSHIRDFESNFKHFKNLKHIKFNRCKSLISVPDLSLVPNLKSLNLDGCRSLVEVHQSAGYHDKLKFLSLQFCSNLSIFPHTLKTKSLQALDLFGCSKLEKFSDIVEKMEHLEELDLGWTAIKELPASIENLLSVKIINLTKCKRLTTLPSSVYKLQNLEYLDLNDCSNFVMFPKNSEDSTDLNGNSGFQNLCRLKLRGCNLSEVEFLKSPSSFPKLRHLDLSRNKFTHLPTCINKYDELEHLIVEHCKQLQKIPQLPPNLHMLRAQRCRSLQEFPDLSGLSNPSRIELYSCYELFRKGANTTDALSPKDLEDSTNPNGNPGFRNLNWVNLNGCNLSELEFLESSYCFPKLAHLDHSHNKFAHLSTCISKYNDLEHLIVGNCKHLQKIPQLPPNVHRLDACCCRSLQEFPDLSGLSSNGLWVDLSSCRELFRKGANTADVLSLKELPKMRNVDILLIGREMPEWFLPCKTDGSISFMVPGDLYDKFLGLALCFVLGPKEGKAVDAASVFLLMAKVRLAEEETFIQ
ncbi:hypothetical protein BT93_J1463 [Corymbia citriodora subsp. variegata]|nr:hypothetical protein BT93_J1463 [Corymbia citriodora subsp. variegata]